MADQLSHGAEPADPSQLVASGYDTMGGRYTALALEDESPRREFTQVMMEALAPGSRVVDLGCGAGEPTALTLSERFNVVGVDISSGQIARARAAVTAASFVLADMSTMQLRPASLDGVTAFYSIIHVPRDRHRRLLEAVFSWLKPGGMLVASMASRGSEASLEEFLGAPMYWSSFDAETNKKLIREVGFELRSAQLIDEETHEGIETHLWVTAHRPTST